MLEDGRRHCDVCSGALPDGATYQVQTMRPEAATLLAREFHRTLDPFMAPAFSRNPDGTIDMDICVDCVLGMGDWAKKYVLTRDGLRMPSARSASPPTVEERAIRYTLRYERQHDLVPSDVHPLKLGWDVESYSVDRARLERRIEVKGTSGYEDEFVTLTEKEKAALERAPESFWIYWAANLGPGRAPILLRIPGTDLGKRFRLISTTEFEVRPTDSTAKSTWSESLPPAEPDAT